MCLHNYVFSVVMIRLSSFQHPTDILQIRSRTLLVQPCLILSKTLTILIPKRQDAQSIVTSRPSHESSSVSGKPYRIDSQLFEDGLFITFTSDLIFILQAGCYLQHRGNVFIPPVSCFLQHRGNFFIPPAGCVVRFGADDFSTGGSATHC